MKYFRFCFFLGLTFMILSCNSPYTPRPKSYPRVQFPIKSYKKIDTALFRFQCRIPSYSYIEEIAPPKNENIENRYQQWANIVFPSLGAKIYLTYKTINDDLQILIRDSYKITYKQQQKATIIKDSSFLSTNQYYGIWFYVGGDAATKYQFLLTDEQKHFVRGSLYFDVTPNEDSLMIVQNFIKQDIDTLLSSIIFR